MNLAVIGSGGREHAICFKLKQSEKVNKLICIPGNAGTEDIAKNIKIDLTNFDKIYEEIKNYNIDLVIVGPEQPLVDGLVDYLKNKKVKVFGPDKFSSQLEGSKAFMKNLCKKHKIPTANFGVFEDIQSATKFIKTNRLPIVVKADGLAAGKGVSICPTASDAEIKVKEILNGKFESSKKVILEEFIEGEEISYFLIVDKNSYHFFGTAQDHKRVLEGDKGLNTGGMGAYSPARNLTEKIEKKILNKIIEPTLKAMRDLGHPYTGFLYAGLMIKNDEPYLIEYNIRMGDPECQVLMMRLETDLLEIFENASKDSLNKLTIQWKEFKCMTIVLCSKGYPGKYIKESEIKNLKKIKTDENNQIFHAGTLKKNGNFFSNGGRVLNITSMDKNLESCRNNCLTILKKIDWIDGFYRKDIGWRAIKNESN